MNCRVLSCCPSKAAAAIISPGCANKPNNQQRCSYPGMSKRLTRLTANEQKPAKPNSEGGNNDAAPRTIGYNAGNSAGCDDGQPNYYCSDFVHGQNSSTVKTVPHFVTAPIA